MVDELSKFLMIDASEINKTVYEMKREFFANDACNFYRKKKDIKALEIFEKNNVPEEFRKVILKLNEVFLSPQILFKISCGEEFVSGKTFAIDIKDDFVKKISGVNKPNNDLYNCYCDPQNTFLTDYKCVPFKEVMDFYIKLRQSGYLESYVNSIIEVLGLKECNYKYDDKFTSFQRRLQK